MVRFFFYVTNSFSSGVRMSNFMSLSPDYTKEGMERGVYVPKNTRNKIKMTLSMYVICSWTKNSV